MDNEQQILDEVASFAQAWNAGDARAAAAYFTEDATRVGAFGDIQHGRPEIEAAYEKLFHQTMQSATVSQERGSVRMLTPEFAVWQGALEIAPGGNRPIIKGHVVQVMKKVQGRWLVLEAHPKFFPPTPLH